MIWSKLNRHQLGKYGEYSAKMEFTKYGFDVYTSEIDNKGIDFVVRNKEKNFFEIQVKAIRKYSYIFLRKEVFEPRNNLFLLVVIFNEINPIYLLVPSMDWLSKKHSFLVDRDYVGKKSKPEYGLTITKSNLEEIYSAYLLKNQLPKLTGNSKFF